MIPERVRTNPWFWATLFLIPLWGVRLLDGDVYWNAVLTVEIFQHGVPPLDRWSWVGQGLPLFFPQIGYGGLALLLSSLVGERGFLALDTLGWVTGIVLWVLWASRRHRTERRSFWVLVMLSLPAVFAMTRMRPQIAGWVGFLTFLLTSSPAHRAFLLTLTGWFHGLAPFLLSLMWFLDARPLRRHLSWMLTAWGALLLLHPLHAGYLLEPLRMLGRTGTALTQNVVEWSSPFALIRRGDALGWVILASLIPGAVAVLQGDRHDPAVRFLALLTALTLLRVRFWVFYLTVLPAVCVSPGKDLLPTLSRRAWPIFSVFWVVLTGAWIAWIPPGHTRFSEPFICTAPHVLLAPLPEANRVVWRCRDRGRVYLFGAFPPDPERLQHANKAVHALRTQGRIPPAVDILWWPARWGSSPVTWPVLQQSLKGDRLYVRPGITLSVPNESVR
ncbi:MAG: hypothetical protein L3J76_00425 [Candidatus Hydrothermae bacterium]|nr:hypothetical protein [Candidatus Hydrothermae bacterium]